ncbi:MAG: hypothetical protein GC200_09500 [Tepidisphaera sp.]|nr:hypothetical protein [Tepidisphaera sp.]
MDTNQLLERVLQENVLAPLLIFSGIIITVVVRSVAGVLKTNAKERTRREIAAFISEGSMTPEQGERLLRSGNDKGGCC